MGKTFIVDAFGRSSYKHYVSINLSTEPEVRNAAMKALACYDSIPFQLQESNKRFMYSRVSGGKTRKSAECT